MYNGPPMHLIADIVLIEPVISLQADFHKVVVMKHITCTNLSIFQVDPTHSFVELFARSQTFLELNKILSSQESNDKPTLL